MKKKLVLALINRRICDTTARLDAMANDAEEYAGAMTNDMCILDELRELRGEIKDA